MRRTALEPGATLYFVTHELALTLLQVGNKSVHIYHINVGERMKDGKFLSSVRRM